ncbi:PEP-CTERM sorting domain-containing protein [Methylomonas sp. LL1]|uniref:PEP-CTERM sorting domain-containing protein n=1 Tax=Methylomonas sp. LL1 TaxID=2785785 RepID=UPI0018C373F4|nr:PEP-CTERM sorting domain-containing protein [Methylomonas sp. LL1]QPK61838.1 PEP-CTERM sorting domain-containing protein [Methylomonas sp. LL1]CAG1022909.1 hypothetical protein MTYM_02056 [Methylococcales bacterium]
MIKKLLSIAAVAGLIFSASAANAALYTFTQTGFTGGATITGAFEGEDLNHDGYIKGATFFAEGLSEISAFSVSFSGNAFVSAFSQAYTDLTLFGFDISRTAMGNAAVEGIATNWFEGTGRYQYLTGVGVNGAQDGYVVDTLTGIYDGSPNLVSVTPAAVPVPGAVWLFGSALMGFIGLKRRKA